MKQLLLVLVQIHLIKQNHFFLMQQMVIMDIGAPQRTYSLKGRLIDPSTPYWYCIDHGSKYGTNDIIGVHLDLKNKQLSYSV